MIRIRIRTLLPSLKCPVDDEGSIATVCIAIRDIIEMLDVQINFFPFDKYAVIPQFHGGARKRLYNFVTRNGKVDGKRVKQR